MQKRGLSGVVTVLLLLLISIVSISIIWLFIQPSIIGIIGSGEDNGQLTSFISCAELDIRTDSCFYNESSVKVGVGRGVGQQEISSLAFKFDGSVSNLFLKDSLRGEVPNEFGHSTIVFSLDKFEQIPKNVRTTIIFQNGEACEFTDTPVNCLEEPESNIECGNGNKEIGEECDDGNIEDGDGCSSTCQLEGQLGQSCDDFGITIIPLSDFDESTCTRTRNGLVASGVDKIPSAGLRVIGSDWSRAAATGASYGRDIIQWYEMYDTLELDAPLDFTELDQKIVGYKAANMKVILTLRANHPIRSEIEFNPNSQTLLQDDSWPKFGQEDDWVDYLKNVTDRYYANPTPEHQGVLVAIQVGNEWGHQFKVNESYGRYTQEEEQQAILDLMNLSYNFIKEVSPNIPVIAFAISDTPNMALGAGYDEQGWKYDGIYYKTNNGLNGITIATRQSVKQDPITSAKSAVVNGSAFYDYFDAHIYFQSPEGARYVANFVRDTWRLNGITGKGLISTEFANPIYNYSYDLHSYNIKAAQAVAYHSGFDAIVWGNWNPSPASPNLLQTSMKFNGGAGYQLPQIYNYTYFQGLSKNFDTVSRHGELLSFKIGAVEKELNLSKDLPPYPSLYQCSDGMDNDGDGLPDQADSGCYDYYNLADPTKCNGQKRQTLNCIDPEGFSENNWIFTF
ncbi:hypothetical protein AUJ84_04325 [Candidatus Pacearchaeota archaeon CG1_02_32_132]|nr:MAG: hypothetical protein AUJ84_04325 [Candidatus Pacearchaeota archaeon CG1_02_32_132]